MHSKIFRWVGFILLVLNLLIFINRKKGFNYQPVATLEDLYPTIGSKSPQTPVRGTTVYYSAKELKAARQLLLDSTDFIRCTSDIERLLCINHYLYRAVCQNHSVGKLIRYYETPLQLFNALRTNKQESFQCGPAAYLHGFFLSAAGFTVRRIQNLQRPHSPKEPDSHVFNEVWIQELNKWVISDLFQNRHLLVKENTPITGADLYQDQAMEKSSPLTIFYSNNDSLSQKVEKVADPFFSKHYYLIYYRETDPSIVYSWKKKIQHYILSYSHFQLYDPIEHRSNARYHLKQFVFFAGLGWLIIFVVGSIRYFFDRSKKHTKIL